MALLVAALSLSIAGCGSSGGGCREVCEKDDQCLGGVNVESCTETCEQLAESDDAYADAIAERADCVADIPCVEIATECRPSGE